MSLDRPDPDEEVWRDIRTVDMGMLAFALWLLALAVAGYLLIGTVGLSP